MKTNFEENLDQMKEKLRILQHGNDELAERIKKMRESNSQKKANQHHKNASEIIRSFSVCLLLFFSLNLSAQQTVNFEEINFLGMSIDQVDVSQKAVPFTRITDKPENGHELRGFYSPSTGAFKLIFNDKHICNSIMLYSNRSRTFKYNTDLYVVNKLTDKSDPEKVTYIIMVKSLLSVR
jgi:hypothetical protein